MTERFTCAFGNVPLSPGARSTCAVCGSEVIAKCGALRVWHWAHAAGSDCDPWAEPETWWHLRAKQIAGRFGQTEVVVGRHRADAIVGDTVIEFQHSPLSSDAIRERETFYRQEVGGIVWVLDAAAFAANLDPKGPAGAHGSCRWSRWRKSWGAATARLLFDLPCAFGFEAVRIEPNEPWEVEQFSDGLEFSGGKPAIAHGYTLDDGCAVLRALVIAGKDPRDLVGCRLLRDERGNPRADRP